MLLGANPYLLAALGGSRTSAVTIGALAATGVGFWPAGLLLGTFGAVKFDWLYWWAGRLWGRGLIEIVAGRSPRAARNAARAERLARRFGVLAIVLTYIVPLPSGVVYATVAAAGMRLRTFLIDRHRNRRSHPGDLHLPGLLDRPAGGTCRGGDRPVLLVPLDRPAARDLRQPVAAVPGETAASGVQEGSKRPLSVGNRAPGAWRAEPPGDVESGVSSRTSQTASEPGRTVKREREAAN